MKRVVTVVWMVASTAVAGLVCASEQPGGPAATLAQQCQIDIKGEKKDEWRRAPRAESSVTQHHAVLGGKPLDYAATAGTLVIRDDDDKPMAYLSYVAYTRRDVKDAATRPILFAFNGGPGSSSMWLHMGVLGPKRVVVSDPDPTPAAPYRLVDNEFGVLDKSDLVMIDPVGTGTRSAIPSSLPFSSGTTSPIARAAPVEAGTMFCGAARIRRRSGLPFRVIDT